MIMAGGCMSREDYSSILALIFTELQKKGISRSKIQSHRSADEHTKVVSHEWVIRRGGSKLQLETAQSESIGSAPFFYLSLSQGNIRHPSVTVMLDDEIWTIRVFEGESPWPVFQKLLEKYPSRVIGDDTHRINANDAIHLVQMILDAFLAH